MKRRLLLFLDGTWNDAEFGDRDTNVIRLHDLIGRSLDDKSQALPDRNALEIADTEKQVAGRTHGEYEYLVFYERGVGTGLIGDRLLGGAFGDGLSGNIRRAYKFLSFNYQPGDEIFVFGFSRGSYTARSLVGYIAAAGLLKRECCTPEREEVAWRYYRTALNDRSPGIWSGLTCYVHDRAKFRIECVGVFDTVGSLGIPVRWAARLNRKTYEFHDVTLSSITKVNLHALAIDEHRYPFQATLWRRPQFKDYASITEQVWFSGSHSDIGGGYLSADERKTRVAPDDITLDWMIQRLRKHFKDFPLTKWPKLNRKAATSNCNNSRSIIYLLWPFALRSIGNNPDTWYSRYARRVSYDRREIPIGEGVHISALRRQRELAGFLGYRALNLTSVARILADTYGKPPQTDFDDDSALKVVDWDGTPLDPRVDAQRKRALALLENPVID